MWSSHPQKALIVTTSLGAPGPTFGTWDTTTPTSILLGPIMNHGCPTLAAFLFLRLGWAATRPNQHPSVSVHKLPVPHPCAASSRKGGIPRNKTSTVIRLIVIGTYITPRLTNSRRKASAPTNWIAFIPAATAPSTFPARSSINRILSAGLPRISSAVL